MTKKKLKKVIPVSFHVRKYLCYYFDEPYVFSKNNFLGVLLSGVLKKGYRTRIMKRAESSYKIFIKQDDFFRLGKTIEWEDCLHFNKAIDHFFRRQLFTYMDINRVTSLQTARGAMLLFLHEMDITEDDINFDSLYRDYERKKKYAKTIRKNIGNELFV